jgi:broad specificity phosphatase PhoE
MGQILLVRHGQASFGAEDYDVLSETGWAQGRRLGAWLAERGTVPTALVRGDMRRHRETLEAVVEGAGWMGVETDVDPGWDEFDHLGIVASYPDLPDGHSARHWQDARAFQEVFERATERWISGDHDGYQETYAGFVSRVLAALDRAGAAAGPGGLVVVVSSGGPVGAACAALVDPDGDAATQARIWQRFNTVTVNSSVTRVVAGSTGLRLLTFNEHAHLTPELLTYR